MDLSQRRASGNILTQMTQSLAQRNGETYLLYDLCENLCVLCV